MVRLFIFVVIISDVNIFYEFCFCAILIKKLFERIFSLLYRFFIFLLCTDLMQNAGLQKLVTGNSARGPLPGRAAAARGGRDRGARRRSLRARHSLPLGTLSHCPTNTAVAHTSTDRRRRYCICRTSAR